MAFSPVRSKALFHGRSLSLPSKLHPSISQFNQNLAAIKASDHAFSSLSSMDSRVHSLTNLYCSIDDLLVLPHIQQIISQGCEAKWADQVLDGYIRLLDACTTAKDLFSQTKHDVQKLLSALRRKDMDGIHRYRASRKKLKKMIQKSTKDLRSKHNHLSSAEKEDETMALVVMLKEAECVAVSVLESSLSFMIGSKVQSGWSLVSKLIPSTKDEDADLNELKMVDSLLQMQGDDTLVMNHLKEMDSSIQILEDDMDCLFRQLIKTRVFLLNILNL